MEEFDDAIKSIMIIWKKGEPTFVLMYSDHLPNLFYDVEMSQDDKFVTKFYMEQCRLGKIARQTSGAVPLVYLSV